MEERGSCDLGECQLTCNWGEFEVLFYEGSIHYVESFSSVRLLRLTTGEEGEILPKIHLFNKRPQFLFLQIRHLNTSTLRSESTSPHIL